MNAKRILLLASLSVGVAGCIAYAQPYPPGPPPPPPDQAYDQGNDQGYPPGAPEASNDPGYPDPGDQQAYPDPGIQDQGTPDPSDPGTYADPGNDQDAQDAYNGQPVSVDFFYRQLSPYGDWIERPNYGWVWYPAHVPAGWRPYRYGRWVNSDYGWTWVSQERFGWATFHYGRWTLDSQYGWVWVPGTDWGPAWVSWQEGGGYVGWAPLPPSVRFRAGVGLDLGGISLSVSLGPSWYSFVPERSFLAARIDTYFVPPARNVTIIRNTTNITSYRVVNNRIINQSLPVQHIEQVTGQRVLRFHIANAANPALGRTDRIQGGQITIFRPRVTTAKPALAPPQAIAQQRPARGPRPPVANGAVGNGSVAPQLGNTRQPVAGGGNRRGRRAPTPEDLKRQDDQEHQDLARHQADEQRQLDQIHQQEQQQARGNGGQAQEVQRRHQAETQALRDQQQGEKQQLEAKHQHAEQTVRSQGQAQRQPPPPRQQPPPKQQSDDSKNKPKDQGDRKPPPPQPQR